MMSSVNEEKTFQVAGEKVGIKGFSDLKLRAREIVQNNLAKLL